jgi:hypothetical protein
MLICSTTLAVGAVALRRPDGDTPTAPLFLGEFEIMLLSYAVRSPQSGIHRERDHPIDYTHRRLPGWNLKLKRERERATLCIEPSTKLSKQENNALTLEEARLLHFTDRYKYRPVMNCNQRIFQLVLFYARWSIMKNLPVVFGNQYRPWLDFKFTARFLGWLIP